MVLLHLKRLRDFKIYNRTREFHVKFRFVIRVISVYRLPDPRQVMNFPNNAGMYVGA